MCFKSVRLFLTKYSSHQLKRKQYPILHNEHMFLTCSCIQNLILFSTFFSFSISLILSLLSHSLSLSISLSICLFALSLYLPQPSPPLSFSLSLSFFLSLARSRSFRYQHSLNSDKSSIRKSGDFYNDGGVIRMSNQYFNATESFLGVLTRGGEGSVSLPIFPNTVFPN